LHRRRDNGLNQYFSWENNIPWPNSGHWGTVLYYDDNFGNYNEPPTYTPPWGVPPGNGVTMADGWIAASYNALNQPIVMGSFVYWGTPNWVWFGYDPLGRCVKRWIGPVVNGANSPAYTNPATYFYYDGWNLLQEGASAFSAQRAYVHGARVDEIVASVNYSSGQLAYHHYDARGHCTLLTNASANIMEQYDYDAFGFPYFYDRYGTSLRSYDPQSQSWLGNSPSGNRFLFTGREWLNDLKLYDFRNRMYQPELGRFLQPDPKHFAAGDYNLYRYCHNDPVNHSDPFGLDTTVVWSNEGNRNQHEPIVVVNGRELAAVTQPALQVTVSAPAANGDVVATVHHIINVRYSDNVGPHNKELQKKEPDHARELDKWRDERGKPKTDFLARRDGPLQGKTPEQVKQMVDHTLRGSFNDAVKETKKHDVPGDHIIIHPKGIRY
jgi:RHS repeat-associated protein